MTERLRPVATTLVLVLVATAALLPVGRPPDAHAEALGEQAPPATRATGSAAGPAATEAGSASGTGRVLVTATDETELAAVREALEGRAPLHRIAPRVLVTAGPSAEVRDVLAGHDAVVEPDVPVTAAGPADEPHAERQWGLENTGQRIPHIAGSRGREGVDVDAVKAWRHTRGSRDVTVAVVDTPVARHGDLEANLLEGRSFAPDPDPQCPALRPTHGTEVAGILGAVGDNDVGIAGIAPRVRILPVDFLDACGDGSLAGAVQAIAWAAGNGADVIVASFASSGSPPKDEVAALRAAIEDAGVPVIAAAGNAASPAAGGRDLSADGAAPVYPASFTLRNQLTVAAVDHHGEWPDFSHYGEDHVELAAPGAEVYTTTLDAAGRDAYAYEDGTSYAAPHVAGAVALTLGLEPVLTSEALLDLARRTTRSLDALDGRVGTGGMLDAGALVTAVAEQGACPTARVPDSDFRDVPAGSVHALAVDCLAWWDVTRGKAPGRYQPQSSVTRGQMASFLATVLQAGDALPRDPGPDHPYPDVAGSVHEDEIAALTGLGVVRGFPDGTYRPSQPVTRAQMATFLINTYEVLAGDAPAPSERWFDDVRGSPHARAADSLWSMGIAAGKEPRVYLPNRDVRRDQMGSFVSRLLDRLVRDGLVAGR